ncbi:MAG: hypothetical protein WB014_12990 [Methanosarcina sp.]
MSEAIIEGIDLDPQESQEERKRRQEQSGQTFKKLEQYMEALIERHRKQPGSDLLSGLITDHDPDGPDGSGRYREHCKLAAHCRS